MFPKRPEKKSPFPFSNKARKGEMTKGASFNGQLPDSPVQVPMHKTTRRGHKANCACRSKAAALGRTSTRSHKAAVSEAG
jgi:hypothetical protein